MDCADELSRLQAAFEAFLAAKGIPSTDTGATRVFRAFQTVSEIVSRAEGPSSHLTGLEGGLVAEVALLREAAHRLLEEASKVSVILESSGPSKAGLPPASRSDHYKQLSPRECEVVDLLLGGHTVLEVSGALQLSANTVRNHVKSIYRKLRVRSQIALIAKLAGRVLPQRATNLALQTRERGSVPRTLETPLPG